MTGDDWNDWNNHALGMLIYGDATDETDDRGRPVRGDTMLLLLNAGDTEVTFTTPAINGEGIWAEMVDTTHRELHVVASGTLTVDPFSLVLLRYGENRRMSSATVILMWRGLGKSRRTCLRARDERAAPPSSGNRESGAAVSNRAAHRVQLSRKQLAPLHVILSSR
jgi:hypothetical protein